MKNENADLISKKWDEKVADFLDIFTYEDEAIKRNNWYQLENLNSFDRYEQWLEYKQTLSENEITEKNDIIDIDIKTIVDNTKNIIEKTEVVVKKKKQKDEDGDNDEEVIVDHDDFDPENQKFEFEVEVGSKINDVIDNNSEDTEEEILPKLVLKVKEIIKDISDGGCEQSDNWNF
jgi:hypothetical protein